MIALVIADAFAQDAPPWREPGDTGDGDGVVDTSAFEDMPEWCHSIPITVDTTPAAGAVGVPVDVRPTVLFSQPCAASAPFDLAVWDPATNEVLATMAWSMPEALPATATLVPPSPLPYDRDLVLSVTNPDYTFAKVPFHTAAEAVPPLQGTLEVAVLEASFVRGEVADQLRATVQVTPIADPFALSSVQLAGPHGATWYAPASLGAPIVVEWLGVATEQVCFEAIQQDGRGGEIGPARDCASLDLPEPEGCGCDGATAPFRLDLVGMMLVLLCRRSSR